MMLMWLLMPMCYLCFSEVLRLGNSTRMNERCLELQKKKKNVATKVKVCGVLNLRIYEAVWINFLS